MPRQGQSPIAVGSHLHGHDAVNFARIDKSTSCAGNHTQCGGGLVHRETRRHVGRSRVASDIADIDRQRHSRVGVCQCGKHAGRNRHTGVVAADHTRVGLTTKGNRHHLTVFNTRGLHAHRATACCFAGIEYCTPIGCDRADRRRCGVFVNRFTRLSGGIACSVIHVGCDSQVAVVQSTHVKGLGVCAVGLYSGCTAHCGVNTIAHTHSHVLARFGRARACHREGGLLRVVHTVVTSHCRINAHHRGGGVNNDCFGVRKRADIARNIHHASRQTIDAGVQAGQCHVNGSHAA